MKALSINPDFALMIAGGEKTVECRTWATDYRGPLLICSTAKKLHGTIPGHALAVVTLKDIVPFEKKHLEDAVMLPSEYVPGRYAWMLDDNKLIVPVPVKGRLSLWNYDGPIEYIPESEWALPDDVNPEDVPAGEWFYKYWQPIMV